MGKTRKQAGKKRTMEQAGLAIVSNADYEKAKASLADTVHTK